MESKFDMPDYIYRNIPGNQGWEGTFYESLCEYGNWNVSEFWKLHLELTLIAIQYTHKNIPKDLSNAITKIHIRVSSCVVAHFNIKDVYEIHNLTNGDILCFKERLDLVVVGLFSGEIISESSFDLKNPLLER